MKRTIKSGLSLVIAVVMCLSLLPMTALAAEEEFIIENGVLKQYNGSGGAVVIPNGITRIGSDSETINDLRVFYYNSDITSVTMPDSLISIGPAAFSGCENLTSITFGNNLTKLGESAFAYCTSLTSITIPNSITNIDSAAFLNCTSLKSVTLSDNLTHIVNNSFRGCTSLTNVTIPKKVTIIDGWTFEGCTNLTSVTIPDGVTSVGEMAFGNTSLKSITIPNSVTSIYSNSFPKDITINGVAGSYAETYAKNNNLTFTTSGTTPTTPPKTDNAPNLDNASGWAKPFVNEAYNNGLIPSSLQSAYTQATTRAEFCALAVTLYEKIKGTAITDRKTFDDTTDINVEKAAAIGVVSGVGNNKFDPNAKLTREQAAVMLARLAEAIGKPFEKKAATFADNGKIATWAIVQVGQIQAAGIMSGTGNNMFSPQDPYTREQSITTINRLYDVLK